MKRGVIFMCGWDRQPLQQGRGGLHPNPSAERGHDKGTRRAEGQREGQAWLFIHSATQQQGDSHETERWQSTTEQRQEVFTQHTLGMWNPPPQEINDSSLVLRPEETRLCSLTSCTTQAREFHPVNPVLSPVTCV